MTDWETHRLDAGRVEHFFRLHSAANGAGWCLCVAWWTPSWEGWGERSAQENRSLRLSLFERGEYDGYLLYADGEPVAWCQVGPRDRLNKLVRQLDLTPDPSVWAITCFLVAPHFRRQGAATRLLQDVLSDLRAQGVRRVEAFPKRVPEMEPEDLWNGPESLFLEAGFQVLRAHPHRPVLSLEL